MLVGLCVGVGVGSGVRLGEGVWVDVGAKVDVELTVAREVATSVGVGLAGTPSQPATAMRKSTASTGRLNRFRPGCRSTVGSIPRSLNLPTFDLTHRRNGANSRNGF